MGMLEMMAMAGSGVVLMLVPALTLPFLYIYLVHDYSGRREGNRDPQLGSKVFTTLLMTVALQLALAGVSLIAMSFVVDGGGTSAGKTGCGLLLAGAVNGLFPTILYYTRVRTQSGAGIAHQALGLNALFAGIVFAAMVVVICQSLFHDGELAEPMAIAVPYGATMIAAGLLLQKSRLPRARVHE